MEKNLEALKAALDAEAAGMNPSRSFKANAEAFKAASVAFHDFLLKSIDACGGDTDYIPDANVLSLDIDHAFQAGEEAADAKVPLAPEYSTMNHAALGLVRGADLGGHLVAAE